MKKYFIILLTLLSLATNAQDLDIYKVKKNANFDLPDLPEAMTYDEFKILSTNLRMQDMLIAVALPGHAHFKIDEKKKGYYILGVRSLGYAAWGYLALNNKSLTSIIVKDQFYYSGSVSNADIAIAYTSLALMLGSYLYDWIHAKYMLDDKQNKIRYKYAKKKIHLGVNFIQLNRQNYPTLLLTYNF